MLRRRRLDLHLRLLAAAAALVFVPLLSFSLGALDETRLIATILSAAIAAVVLAEFLLAGSRPDALAAAGRLDALSGDQALFASALDLGLDRVDGPIAELFRRRLDAAIEALRGRDPLPRRNLALAKLLLALLILDAALVALPGRAERVADSGLGELRSFVVAAGRSDELDAARKEALTAIERAATREEMIRRADEAWRRERIAGLAAEAIEEALSRLERALESGERDEARRSGAELRARIEGLDRDRAERLAARLRELALRFPEAAAALDLDDLADAAAGAGAGLAEGGPGTRVAARAAMERILVALYDGLGTLPPSGSGVTTQEPGDRGGAAARPDAPLGGPAALPLDVAPADRALIERYFRLRSR